MAERVDGYIGVRQRPAAPRNAPQERAQAREQLVERERLRQVVVGACVEAGDAVGHFATRGEHEDRDRVLGGAELPADVEPVGRRHHHVEHGGIRLVTLDRE